MSDQNAEIRLQQEHQEPSCHGTEIDHIYRGASRGSYERRRSCSRRICSRSVGVLGAGAVAATPATELGINPIMNIPKSLLTRIMEIDAVTTRVGEIVREARRIREETACPRDGGIG